MGGGWGAANLRKLPPWSWISFRSVLQGVEHRARFGRRAPAACAHQRRCRRPSGMPALWCVGVWTEPLCLCASPTRNPPSPRHAPLFPVLFEQWRQSREWSCRTIGQGGEGQLDPNLLKDCLCQRDALAQRVLRAVADTHSIALPLFLYAGSGFHWHGSLNARPTHTHTHTHTHTERERE